MRRRRQQRREADLTISLTLLCAGATPMSRAGGFAAPTEGLDPAGREKAARLRLGTFDQSWSSPALAARETLSAIGSTAITTTHLADIDHGTWGGRTFAEIEAATPGPLYQWLANPAAGAPDGESLADVVCRIAIWLDQIATRDGSCLAVTHPMTVRAALIHAIAMPDNTACAIDIAPLSATTLSFNRRWRLQELRKA